MPSRRSLLSPREAEVTQLLLDWPDAFPPSIGGDDLGVPTSGGGEPSYGNNGWPLTEESMRRFDSSSMVGDSYKTLEKGLRELEEEKPRYYRAISAAYLDPDVGHSEVDHWRRNAESGSLRYQLWVTLHDKAISWLATRLKDAYLWVRWPEKVKPGNLKAMEERHEEFLRVFDMYMDQGLKESKAKQAAAEKCDISERHARRIVSSRRGE